MRSENTPGDELAIYCLSSMYLRHVFVKTSKLFWTTVSHKWEDDESSVRKKCELFLLYLGHGRYGKYISVVTPEQEVLTLDDLSTNKPDDPKSTRQVKPAAEKMTKLHMEPVIPKYRHLSMNKPSIHKKESQTKPKSAKPSLEPELEKRITRTKRHINYANLNLGLDSSDDKSPPRKCKQSKASALCEPSQTVIAARNQRMTRKSLQNSV